jgi:hypothetical protein
VETDRDSKKQSSLDHIVNELNEILEGNFVPNYNNMIININGVEVAIRDD